MGNIKKFLKYLLPVIALPMLSSYVSSMYSMAVNALGSSAIAARSIMGSVNNLYSSALYLIAIAILCIAALLSEKGKVKAAKTLHLISLFVYAVTIVLIAAVYFFLPQAVLSMYGAPSETFALGISYARAFILPVLLVCTIAALISQLSGRHSFILCIAAGAGIITLASFIGVALVRMLGFGINGIAITDGLCFAAASVMPFLMVPVKSYAEAFAPEARL